VKITRRQLRRIIKEEKRKLTEDEDWVPQKQTSRGERTNQAHQIAAILNQIDELMETAYRIALDMESNEDDEGLQNIRARVDSWSDSYSGEEW
jgi:hypothetical protein